ESVAVMFLVDLGFGVFFFSSRRRHTRFSRDWSSDVCSSDLHASERLRRARAHRIMGRLPTAGEPARPQLLTTSDIRSVATVPSRSEERRVGTESLSRGSPKNDKESVIADRNTYEEAYQLVNR